MTAAESTVVRVATGPVFAATLFAGSLWLVFYTDLLRWSLYDQLGYEWLLTHLLLTGCLLVVAFFRPDQSKPQLSRPWLLSTLIALTLVSALFAINIMTRSDLMVSEWFGARGRTWGLTPLQDQAVGGTIALSIGGTLAAMTVVVVIRWKHSNPHVNTLVSQISHVSRKDIHT